MTQNRMSREMCYCAIKMGENELYHHGVLGMSWGDRNGPPYPLSGRAKKIARAEAKAKREKEKKLEKMRKMAAKKRKEAAKLQKKQDKINKMKEELIRKGDIEKIRKKRKYFSNEELQYAMERNAQLVEAKYTKGYKKAGNPHAMENLMTIIDRVGKIATAAVPVVNFAKGMSELKTMNLNREISEINRQRKATEDDIRLVKEFDKEAAAQMASRALGRKIENKSDPDEEERKKFDKAKREMELVEPFDKDAAAKIASDYLGRPVTSKGKSDSEKRKEAAEVAELVGRYNKGEAAKYLGDVLGGRFKGMKYEDVMNKSDTVSLIQSLTKLADKEKDPTQEQEYRNQINTLLKSITSP